MHNLYSSNTKRSYKKYILHIQFIDSARFMASLLSNLVNLSEGIHRINVNMDMMIKNVKHVELNISIVTVLLNTQILKMI